MRSFQERSNIFLDQSRQQVRFLRDALSISVAICVGVEGRPTPLYFTSMPSQHGLYRKLEEMFDENNGSDKARQIRTNISSVRVNVARLAAGGIKEKTMKKEIICLPFAIRYVKR